MRDDLSSRMLVMGIIILLYMAAYDLYAAFYFPVIFAGRNIPWLGDAMQFYGALVSEWTAPPMSPP